jgi:hypothetical protein
MGYTRTTLGDGRIGYVVPLFRKGWTVEQLKAIALWASTNAFMRGQNDSNRAYDDWDTLYGSVRKCEKYWKLAQATDTRLVAGSAERKSRVI